MYLNNLDLDFAPLISLLFFSYSTRRNSVKVKRGYYETEDQRPKVQSFSKFESLFCSKHCLASGVS